MASKKSQGPDLLLREEEEAENDNEDGPVDHSHIDRINTERNEHNCPDKSQLQEEIVRFDSSYESIGPGQMVGRGGPPLLGVIPGSSIEPYFNTTISDQYTMSDDAVMSTTGANLATLQNELEGSLYSDEMLNKVKRQGATSEGKSHYLEVERTTEATSNDSFEVFVRCLIVLSISNLAAMAPF